MPQGVVVWGAPSRSDLTTNNNLAASGSGQVAARNSSCLPRVYT
jgi:hypothetical protein